MAWKHWLVSGEHKLDLSAGGIDAEGYGVHDVGLDAPANSADMSVDLLFYPGGKNQIGAVRRLEAEIARYLGWARAYERQQRIDPVEYWIKPDDGIDLEPLYGAAIRRRRVLDGQLDPPKKSANAFKQDIIVGYKLRLHCGEWHEKPHYLVCGKGRIREVDGGLELWEGTTNLCEAPNGYADSWTADGATLLDNDQSEMDIHGGAVYARQSFILQLAGAAGGMYRDEITNPIQGVAYTLTANAKGIGGTIGKTCNLKIEERGGAQAAANTTQAVTLTATPQLVTVTHTVVEADRTDLRMILEVAGSAADEIFVVSDIQLELNSYATPYVDGWQGVGRYWTGPVDQSTTMAVAAGLWLDAHTYVNFPSGSASLYVKDVDWDSGQAAYIFDCGEAANYNRLRLYKSAGNELILSMFDRQGNEVTVSVDCSGYVDADWYHIVACWARNNLRLYVNGVSVGTPITLEEGPGYTTGIVALNVGTSRGTQPGTGHHVARAPGGTRVWVGYERYAGAASRCYASYSDDNGASWTEIAFPGDVHQRYSAIAVDTAGNLHAFWVYNGAHVYHSRYTGSWAEPDVIITGWSPGEQYVDACADLSGNVHVAIIGDTGLVDPGYAIVYCKYTGDGHAGLEWVHISPNWVVSARRHALFADSSGVHLLCDVTYTDTGTIVHELRYWERTDAWQAPVILYTNTWENADYTSGVAVDAAGSVHVAMAHAVSIADTTHYIKYRKRTGANWGGWETVTVQDLPGCCVNGIGLCLTAAGAPFVVWSGVGWGSYPNHFNVHFCQKSGDSWSARTTVAEEEIDNRYATCGARERMFAWTRYEGTYDVRFANVVTCDVPQRSDGDFNLGTDRIGANQINATIGNDLRLYGQALTVAQVQALYDAGRGPGMLGYIASRAAGFTGAVGTVWRVASVLLHQHEDADAEHQNWAQIGNVPGDLPAPTRWWVRFGEPAPTGRTAALYYGLRQRGGEHALFNFDIHKADELVNSTVKEADPDCAYGYRAKTTENTTTWKKRASWTVAGNIGGLWTPDMRGRWRVCARVYDAAASAGLWKVRVRTGGNDIIPFSPNDNGVSAPVVGKWTFLEIGEVELGSWEVGTENLHSYVELWLQYSGGGAAIFYTDFVLLLPASEDGAQGLMGLPGGNYYVGFSAIEQNGIADAPYATPVYFCYGLGPLTEEPLQSFVGDFLRLQPGITSRLVLANVSHTVPYAFTLSEVYRMSVAMQIEPRYGTPW